MSPEGGSTGTRLSTRESESSLSGDIMLTRGAGAARWGFFLRAETMHGYYTYLEQNPGPRGDPQFHEMSHGEGFLEVLRRRVDSPGLCCLDETESALSFSSSLALVGVLNDLANGGAQVLCATHSPVIAARPGATILEIGDWGIRETTWAELELVQNWRAYLESPQRYLRHVLD
jgi:predicted ATPase